MSPRPGTLVPRPVEAASPCARSDVHVLPWSDHLDALEEWLRRGRALFAGGDDVVDLPPLVSVPDGVLPAALHLRAAATLQELERLLAHGQQRLHTTRRGAAYSRY